MSLVLKQSDPTTKKSATTRQKLKKKMASRLMVHAIFVGLFAKQDGTYFQSKRRRISEKSGYKSGFFVQFLLMLREPVIRISYLVW